jgi:outer membrane lipoprotein-sorting protein
VVSLVRGERVPRGRYGWLFLLMFGCLSLSWAGCVRKAPVLEPVDLPVAPILERLGERRVSLASFQASGTLRIESRGQQWSGRALVLAKFPHRLRLELLSFFGQPVLYIVSDGEEAITWMPGENASRGFALGKVIAGFTSLPLQDDEAMLLLAGVVPEFLYQETRLFRDPQDGDLVLSLEDQARRKVERVWLEEETGTVCRLQRIEGGSSLLDATFSEFAEANGSSYPREVKIEVGGAHLALRYQVFVPNVQLDDDVFHLELPPGVKVLPQ